MKGFLMVVEEEEEGEEEEVEEEERRNKNETMVGCEWKGMTERQNSLRSGRQTIGQP